MTAAWHRTDASVHSGAIPTAWTNLDLSGETGAATVWALLAITPTSDQANNDVYFRPDGDTYDWSLPYAGPGNGAHYCVLNRAAGVSEGDPVVLIQTSSSGIVEWKCATASETADVTLIGYVDDIDDTPIAIWDAMMDDSGESSPDMYGDFDSTLAERAVIYLRTEFTVDDPLLWGPNNDDYYSYPLAISGWSQNPLTTMHQAHGSNPQDDEGTFGATTITEADGDFYWLFHWTPVEDPV